MIDLTSAKFLVNSISFLLVYFVITTAAGSFRSWVAARMGDTTAQDAGLVTWNPFVHMNPIGLFFLLINSFGWGQYVPINPSNIQGKYRQLRLFTAYFSDVFLHIFLAIIGLLILIVWFDPIMIAIIHAIILTRDVSHLYIAQYYSNYSSFSVVVAFIIAASVSLNVGLAVLELLLNTCMYFLQSVVSNSYRYMEYSFYFMLLAPLILMIFFYCPLLIITTNIVSYIGYTLASLVRIF